MGLQRFARALTNSKGQTMVEFALIVALFLAILFGIMEFGRVWFYSNHLNNSVRAATRYGCMLSNFSTNDELRPAVTAYLTDEIEGFLPPDIADGGIRINAYDENGDLITDINDAGPGDTLEVSVDYDFTVLTGSIIPFFNSTHTLNSVATMPFE